MIRIPSAVSWSVGLLLGLSALACTPGGVGDPCTPEDEYQQGFNGFQVTETNAESRSFQCETRLCLVNHFQGRVSCRLGQTAAQADPASATYNPVCSIPGTPVAKPDVGDNITVEVPPQLAERQTDQAVYCSCRCDGPDKNARYCECPEGFQCEPLVDDLKIGCDEKGVCQAANLAGSYCIRAGSKYDPTKHFKGAPSCNTDAERRAGCGCDPALDAKKYPADCGAKTQ